MLTADTITDEQIREYGYMAMANGNHIDVRRAHLALAIPPVSWEPAWADRAQVRAIIAWDISRADSPYADIARCAEILNACAGR
jgi:hypothetical protein